MKKKELEKKLAVLESINDQLEMEIEYVDHLMRQLGFSDGINSIKGTALEIYDNDLKDIDD